MSYIVPWLFIIFYVIVLFFYTHILINMYICCVFFKLPHSFWCFPCFIVVIWDESGITSESWRSVFISKGGEKPDFYSTFFSGIVLPALYIKTSSFFSLFVCCGSSVLKALPTCLYVETTRLSTELCCHSLPRQFLLFCGTRQYLLTGQGYLGLRALTPTPP